MSAQPTQAQLKKSGGEQSSLTRIRMRQQLSGKRKRAGPMSSKQLGEFIDQKALHDYADGRHLTTRLCGVVADSAL